jgi:hypothetical protein
LRHSRLRASFSEALVIAALVLLPLLFWWRLWAPNPADRATIPQGDFAGQYYPLQLFASRELAAGRLPAWDPYLNAGQPGLADIQSGTFYPLNLLQNLVLALLGVPLQANVLTWQIVVHFSLASLFTYLFVRHLARRAGARVPAARFAGAISALSFTYAGYLTSFPVQQLTILETAIWLPLVLLFVDRAFHRADPWPQLFLAGLALACAFLAGHPQTAMYVVYATVAYGLFQVAGTGARASRPAHRALRAAQYVVLPLGLGAALAAVQLVPALQFIAHSTRAGLDYEAVSWGFPLAEVTHLLYPGYFGGSPQYVGILPPILAVAAFFVKRSRRQVVFWMGVAVVAFVLAFGGNTFLYNVAYLVAPGFGAVRDQERAIYLFSFAVSVLAGFGALLLVQPLPRGIRRGVRRFTRGLGWVFVAFAGLTALWYLGFVQGAQQGVELNMFDGVLRHHVPLLLLLAGSVILFGLRTGGLPRRKGLMVLALGLVGLNLFTVNGQFNVIDPTLGGPTPSTAEGPFVKTGLVSFLREQPGPMRVSSAGLLPGGASAAAVYQVEDITANTPLRLDAFQRFEDGVQSWRRWQLLNVHFVLSDRELEGPGLEQVYAEENVRVYRVGDPLPRAWMVYRTETVDDAQVVNRLNAQDFDPRQMALLPSGVEGLAAAEGQGPGTAAQGIETAPGRLAFSVSPEQDGLLVISQPYYPGWQARVDGQKVSIYRVDGLLQGLPLVAGLHHVELTYHLPAWPAVASLVTFGGCLLGLWWKRKREYV